MAIAAPPGQTYAENTNSASNMVATFTATGTYNAATNGQTTTIDVQQGNTVQTGIVAGRPGVRAAQHRIPHAGARR